MLEYQRTPTSGGWDSIDNILAGIGKGADVNTEAFFTAPQRDAIKSEMVQPAGGTGQTYRYTPPENQSMIETALYKMKQWIGSPYEKVNAIPVKTAESKALASSISSQESTINQGLDWALGSKRTIQTLWDQVKNIYSPREVTVETPREGAPEGEDVRHTNEVINRGVDVVTTARNYYEQVKGLFGLGYPQDEPQPSPATSHDVKPGGVYSPTIAILLVILLVLGLTTSAG